MYTPMVRHTGTTKGKGMDGGITTQAKAAQRTGRVIDMNTDTHFIWYLAGAMEWHYGVNEYFGSGYISAYDGEQEVMGDFITEAPYEYSCNIRNTYGQDYGYCKRVLIDTGDFWKGVRYIPSGNGAMHAY